MIAFVLVGRGFLFLGKLRATIIPIVAIPVAWSAPSRCWRRLPLNTISLLALVLGIGIVVDDAIVVVENVERVMAEEPELDPQARRKKRWRRSPAR